MHEVLINRLGGLSLPRKSVVRLTDRPDMTLDVYRGRKNNNATTTTTTVVVNDSNSIYPFLTSGLGHPYHLDESIFSLRGFW